MNSKISRIIIENKPLDLEKHENIYTRISYFLLILLMLTIPIYSFYKFKGVSLSRIMPFVLLLNIIWAIPLFLKKIRKTQIEILFPLFLFLIYVSISIYSHWDLYGVFRYQRFNFAPIGYSFILSDLTNFALLIFLFLRFPLIDKKKQAKLLIIFCFSVLILNILSVVIWSNIAEGRLLGSAENPNITGQDMAMCFLFITLFIPALTGNSNLNLISKILATIFLILCFLSGSRSSLLFLFFPFLCLFLIKKRKVSYFKYSAVLLLSLFFVIWITDKIEVLELGRLVERGREISAESRWTTWKESIQSWQEAPFFGKGWRLLFDKPSHWWPHCTILWILESLGIFGFLIFSLFYFQVFGALYQKWQRTSSENKQYLLICLIIFLDITLKGLTSDILTERDIIAAIGIIMSSIYI